MIRPAPFDEPRSRPGAAGGGLALALFLFFVSGLVALLDQVVWQRMLGILTGVSATSVTIVVAAFMAGLGVGNLAGGWLADRSSPRGNLLTFAAVELALAAFAIASKPFLYDFLYGRHPELAATPHLLAAVVFASLLVPTFCMGVSLPLLARALVRRISDAAGVVGGLYAVNTLGAATGAILTTWVLLRQADLETILRLGAVGNLATALAATGLAVVCTVRSPSPPPIRPSTSPAEASAPADPAEPPPPGSTLPLWIGLYTLSGFLALSLEVVWFRVLGILQKSTTFTFGTLVGIYLFGLSAGTLVGIALVRRARNPARTFLALQTAVVVLAVGSLALFVALAPSSADPRSFWGHLGETEPPDVPAVLDALARRAAGEAVPVEAARAARRFVEFSFALPGWLIALPTFAMGLSFPFLQKAVQTDLAALGRRVGWLQSANIAGSVLGVVATGELMLPLLGSAGTLRLLALLSLLFPLVGLARMRGLPRRRRKRRVALTAVGVLLLAASLPGGRRFWADLHGTARERILFAEGRSGLALLKGADRTFGGLVFVMSNGLGQSSIPFGGVHSVLGALPALLHPSPADVAVIGLGSGDTLFHAAGRAETRQVVCIEIVGEQLDVLRQLARLRPDPALSALLADSRVRYVLDDGRAFLRRSPQRFDIVEADPLRPGSAFAGNLYSLEYFNLLRSRLKPGGIAVSWVPTPRTRNTFLKAFPHVLEVGGVLIGSGQPIPFDLETLRQRMDAPEVRAYYSRAGERWRTDLEMLLAQRTAYFGPSWDRSSLTEINRDLFARDEFAVAPARSGSDSLWRLFAPGRP